jgi:hypothetical protein
VVVYQDRTDAALKLARSNSKTPDLASNWTVQDVFPAGDPNGTNVGDYVSFRIDTAAGTEKDRIHIAAVRGADLVYITGTRNASTGAYDFSPSLAVDSPGKVGKWVDLSLDNAGKPYITYLTSGGTYGGARMVFQDPDKFTKALSDRNGKSITGWEGMNIPAVYRVESHRLSIENFPVRGIDPGTGNTRFWYAAVGYIGEDRFRAAYYLKY